MTTQQPEALRLAEILEGDYCPDWFYEQGVDEVSAELRRQHARIADLEAQLEAIGAGGVSGPLIGQPQAMPDLSQLTERGAKAWAGVDAQGLREGFTAADMATAAAQGFRDGVASVSSGWISVDERLPEKNTEVLICFAELSIPSTGRYTASALDHEGWCYPQENHLWPGEHPDFEDGGSPTVTHWMPLPAAHGPADGESNV